ncbi:MAG TPA: hypothetical protein VNL74_00955 [Methylococcus sp.]|nr:hypothetical protein [Methylococcus sp.]
MIYNFDTDDREAATAALLVYAIYRSRDRRRFKVTPDLWGQIERFTKASAKRARNVPDFLEKFKPRLSCETIHPRWMVAGVRGLQAVIDSLHHTAYVESAHAREFLTGVLRECDERAVIDRLYKHTAWIILLCRDRLEREKPIESKIDDDGEIA